MIKIPTTQITSLDDVRRFFGELHEAGIAFHPDDSLTTYINIHTGEPSFSTEEGERLDSLMDKATAVCREASQDICAIACEFV